MNILKKTLTLSFFFILLIGLGRLFAQNELKDYKGSKNAVYGELLGNGGIYSLNYERMFYKNGIFEAHLRIGGEYLPAGLISEKKPGMVFVLGVNELFGKSKHKFEAGINFSHVIGLDSEAGPIYFVSGNIGYRKQPEKSGFLFRVGAVPLINSAGALRLIGGVSFGYVF